MFKRSQCSSKLASNSQVNKKGKIKRFLSEKKAHCLSRWKRIAMGQVTKNLDSFIDKKLWLKSSMTMSHMLIYGEKDWILTIKDMTICIMYSFSFVSIQHCPLLKFYSQECCTWSQEFAHELNITTNKANLYCSG